jgi:predicted nucleic acid-binding Zn finger protein
MLREPPPKAIKAVVERRVVRLTAKPVEKWVVMGETGDYLVIPMTYCSCPLFTFKWIPGQTDKPCYHLVAVELAKRSGIYHDLSGKLDARTLSELVRELLLQGRSSSLRKYL